MNRTRIWIAASALLAVLVVAGYATAHVLSGDAEVRISARRLDDGRTEFALQQRTDGEWAERILPSSRYFPARPGSDRWLNSSPLMIETTEEVNRTPGRDSFRNGEVTTIIEVDIPYGSSETALNSYVSVKSNSAQGEEGDGIVLVVGCHGGLGTGIVWFVSDLPPLVNGDYPTQFSYLPNPAGVPEVTLETWVGDTNHWDHLFDGEYYAYPLSGVRIYHLLKDAEEFTVTLQGSQETIDVTFSLDGVFDTPIQPNLDYCGQYY